VFAVRHLNATGGVSWSDKCQIDSMAWILMCSFITSHFTPMDMKRCYIAR